jgi:hypothetical protein
MLLSSYAIRLALSLHNGMLHDSDNNSGNSRNVDGAASALAEGIIMSRRITL